MVDIPALTREELEALGDTVMPDAFYAKGAVPKESCTPDGMIEAAGPLTIEHAQAAQAWVEAGRPELGRTRENVVTDLKSVRYTHHRLAQCLAGGMDNTRAAQLCNYAPSRVSDLRHDPAFQELVAHYKGQVDEEFASFVSVASALSMDVLHRLQEMLDLTPEKFTPQIATEALKVIAPLGGHAPVNKSINLNVNADLADKLASARRRVAARGGGNSGQ